MNEIIVLLENAAAAGWVFLVAIGAAAVGLLIFDRKRNKRVAESRQAASDRKAA